MCQNNLKPTHLQICAQWMSLAFCFMPALFNRHSSTLWCHFWWNRHKWRCESWTEACGYGAGATESQVMLLYYYYFRILNSKEVQHELIGFNSWLSASHKLYTFFQTQTFRKEGEEPFTLINYTCACPTVTKQACMLWETPADDVHIITHWNSNINIALK